MLTKNQLKTFPVHTKQKGHISLMREKFISNRVLILTELQLSEDKYRDLFFEAGCLFLEQMYNREDEHLSVWYERLAKDSRFKFWKWFEAEFKILENDWLNILAGGNYKLTEWRFKEFLDQLTNDIYLEQSLTQFLSRLPYVEL